MNNDIIKELSANFIEYAAAVNTDRAIPNATDGLKPVAKRILYESFIKGFSADKPHVKSANIVGSVMSDLHPHSTDAIYEALVRLSRNWIMRYPLIDFHGSNGNIDGDGAAASRYTEARLSKITEDGMLEGIKHNKVDFIPNYSETMDEPIDLPAVFPNLLCNPNNGIGVALASSWGCHNLREVAQAIYDYIDGKDPSLPGPDFPTGGTVINKDAFNEVIKTGRGSIIIRGNYKIENNNIVFYEIPYGVNTETILEEAGKACDEEKIKGIKHIRNESNKKGLRLVFECDKKASLEAIVQKLFAETSLQSTFAYNQTALVEKTPVELNLKDCIKIYVDFNKKCIIKETNYNINEVNNRLEVINGLLKALEDIDNIIALIKQSESSAKAQVALVKKYSFTERQAKAIVDMKLGQLAGLEKIELENTQAKLNEELNGLKSILNNPIEELKLRLNNIVKKYGDPRRTQLLQLNISKNSKEEKIIEPEKCVVTMTAGGLIKRTPTASFKTQARNGKGVRNKEEITSFIIRTNTVDKLLLFSNKGKMFSITVDDIPTSSTPIQTLIKMETDEVIESIYSFYKDTDAKYVLFITKKGLAKRTELSEFTSGRNNKIGVRAITIKDGDAIASINLIKEEDIIAATHEGMSIRVKSTELALQGKNASGTKLITLKTDSDYVVSGWPVRNSSDTLGVFYSDGTGKRVALNEFTPQGRGGKGLIIAPKGKEVVSTALLSDEDTVLVAGTPNNICISASEIRISGRASLGVKISSGNNITCVSKI